MTDDRRALAPNRDVLDALPSADVRTRGALVPQTMGEAMELAKVMASGRLSVPSFFHGNPGDALRIVMIAQRTGLDPFTLAEDCYVTPQRGGGDRMAMGAKAIYAITLASGVLEGALDLQITGEGEAMTARVTGRRRGATPRSETYHFRTISVRNSPLWKSQPRQQFGYYCQRAWCRLHAPDAIMGLVAREDPQIDAEATDITPAAPQSAVDRVAAQLSAPVEVAQDTDGASGEPAVTSRPAGEGGATPPPSDPDTGELFDGEAPEPDGEPTLSARDYAEQAKRDLAKLAKVKATDKAFASWAAANKGHIDALPDALKDEVRAAFKRAKEDAARE